MIRIFLTDNRADQAGYLRDQFRHFPDEFVLSNIGYKVRVQGNALLNTQQLHRIKTLKLVSLRNKYRTSLVENVLETYKIGIITNYFNHFYVQMYRKITVQ